MDAGESGFEPVSKQLEFTYRLSAQVRRIFSLAGEAIATRRKALSQ